MALRTARCPARAAASQRARARRRGVGRGDGQVAHLAAAPRARSCRTGAGARRAAPARRPSRGSRARRAGANHRSPSRLSMIAGRCWRGCDQRQAGQRAHLQVELRHVAGVHAVVAAVVRPRRHLVDHQRAVLAARRTRRTARRRSRVPAAMRAAAADGLAAAAPATCRPPAPAVTARMPSRCRFCCTGRCTIAPSRAARHDHRAFGGQRQQLLQHAGHAPQAVPGGGAARRASSTRTWPLPS